MADIIEMPKLSDTMTTGTLVAWLKNEGDEVASGDMIAEIETDKATMEVESFSDGVLLKQYVQAGGELPIGAALCAIGESGEEAPAVDNAAAAPTAPAEEAPAPQAAAPAPAATPAAPAPAPAAATTSSGRVKASPLAKKIAEEKGIDLNSIQGSGPGGRIVKADVLSAKPGSPAAAPAAAPVAFQTIGESQKIPVSNMRGVIANRLVECKNTVPHFYVEVEVDTAPLAKLRKNLNGQLADLEPEQGGIKFSVNDLILKATAEALNRVPAVNTSWMGDHIIQHGSVHLAFGVAIEDGLVTPVIRDAQAKSLRTLALEAKSLIGKARNKKLKPDEMSGSTFTVTNLGMYGVSNFFGIINPPNAGILSVSASQKVPVVDANNNIVAGQRMSMGFSGDHRVVDGAVGAEFLKALKDILETPEVMLV